MRNWPEFVGGKDYSVELESEDERVTIGLITRDGDDGAYVLVRGEDGGRLFLAALGLVSYELAANSDEVMVMRWEGPNVI
jgi:hypothetical protein